MILVKCSTHVSMKSVWPYVSLKANISLLIFCLDDLSITVNGVLMSPTVITLNFSLYVCLYLLYVISCSFLECICIYNCYSFLLDLSLYHRVMSFSLASLCFKVYFVLYEYCYPGFIFISIGMKCVFSSSSLSVCVCL